MEGLHFRDAGRGPAVLLLHGAPSPAADLDALAGALTPRFRVLCPDLPGYGLSAALAGREAFASTRALLESGLRARGVEELSVVGYSLGGYRAIDLAVNGTLRIARVACLAGFAFVTAEHAESLLGLETALRNGLSPRSPELRDMARTRFVARAFAEAQPEAVERVADWLALPPPAVLAGEIAAMRACADLQPALRSRRLDVLARCGEEDQVVPLAYSEAIARAASGRLEAVKGVGHALLVEDGPATVAAVRDFLVAAAAP